MKNSDYILQKASDIINGDRQCQYGKAEDNFEIIADFWTAYLNNKLVGVLHPSDVANMMILLKVARNSSGVFKCDNWIDICGYAALGGEIESNGVDIQEGDGQCDIS